MPIVRELSTIKPVKGSLLSIGVFDGVHLGHQYLITHLRDIANRRGLLSGVVTFKTHPQAVLKHRRIYLLDDLDVRLGLIKKIGVDFVVPITFNEDVAEFSARQFIECLREHLKMEGLVIGPDFALGKKREGNIEKLKEYAVEMGFSVDVTSPVKQNDEVVSSSVIRAALLNGDIELVNKLLGRPFMLRGEVMSGDRRGRELGFPTANLEPHTRQALPEDGVYATIVRLEGMRYHGVTNVGVRPTFNGDKRLIETHILEFTGDLPGKWLEVDIMKRLRGEQRFDSKEKLKVQIAADIEEARKVLNTID